MGNCLASFNISLQLWFEHLSAGCKQRKFFKIDLVYDNTLSMCLEAAI